MPHSGASVKDRGRSQTPTERGPNPIPPTLSPEVGATHYTSMNSDHSSGHRSPHFEYLRASLFGYTSRQKALNRSGARSEYLTVFWISRWPKEPGRRGPRA